MSISYKPMVLGLALVLVTGCRTIAELKLVGIYDSELGEGAAEIVSYDPTVNRAFVVNSEAGTIDVLQMTASGSLADGSASHTIDVKTAYPGIELGIANSVAAMDGIVAVAKPL
jgi:hypothetical protein